MKQRKRFWVYQVFNLSQKTGSAFFTNAYMSKKFGITKRTVQNWLNKLAKEGFIKIGFFEGARGTERRINITELGLKLINKKTGL
jgi:Mn-dependent DtxR family transcriptional regulator